jgi:dTDP-4-amino-4,6-dideoxygalactose transaminase
MSDCLESVPFFDLATTTSTAEGIRRNGTAIAWQPVLCPQPQYGELVENLEKAFAAYCDATSCVGVRNGTVALELILAALGFGPGDEVIVPANAFIATADAVCAVGARPKFVDVLPESLLIDPDAVTAAVGPDTTAVIATHQFGQMADLDALLPVARRHGLALIEDASQAHGARLRGRRAGSVGAAAAFSFHPGMTLGGLGSGGAVVTMDPELAARVRRLAERNRRLDGVQAAMLTHELSSFDSANSARRQAMDRYRRHLPPWCWPLTISRDAEPVFHLAVVLVHDRSAVIDELKRSRIGWGVHYPVPCHLQPEYQGFIDSLPAAESAAKAILSLPMYPSITDSQIDRVTEVLWKVRPDGFEEDEFGF